MDLAKASETQVVDLNVNSEGRVFDGIGALSAGAVSRLLIDYPEPQRSEILDFLFKPNFGASFQHLKIEVGGDGNSTLGSEPSHARTRHELEHPEEVYFSRGYELWLATEAKKRNPSIILDCLPWSAAGWVEHFTPGNAEYMISFLKGAKKYFGLDFDYVGMWNEFRYETDYIKLFRRVLDENGFQNLKIVAADEYMKEFENGDIYSGWAIADDVLKDPELAKAVGVIGVHYAGYLEFPMGLETFDSTENAKKTGLPLWSSESGLNKWWSSIPKHREKQQKENDYLWTNRGSWLAVQEHAKLYNRCYISGKMTNQVLWGLISAYYKSFGYSCYSYGSMEAREPWSGHYRVYPLIWATAHTTQFTQPGWRYIDSGCVYLRGGGSCVTLKSPSSEDYSIIIETFGATMMQELTFKVSDGFLEAPLKVWKSTSEEHLFEQGPDIQPEAGMFSIDVPPNCLYSLTTTTGQHKGHAEIPPSKPFPFPYSDTFQDYAVGKTPKYLSAMEGAFEVIDDDKSGEKCLAQVVESPVMSWSGVLSTCDPYTVIGGGEWFDYQVSADVNVGSEGYAGIAGRGLYVLKLYHDGNWELAVDDKKLASGLIGDWTPGWHNLKLVMEGNVIQAYIDETGVTHLGIEDTSYASGMVALKSSWSRTKFRNLIIKR